MARQVIGANTYRAAKKIKRPGRHKKRVKRPKSFFNPPQKQRR
jgi:hypothetical protein